MCYRPISIINPRITYRPSVDKLYMSVPCGHCYECLKEKRDNWFVRLYYETLRSSACFFPTFTFNDDSLPLFSLTGDLLDIAHKYVSEVPHIYNMPSFDKKQIQNTIKKLRQYLGIDNIKYFLVSEYGHKRHRPHYHVLIFIPIGYEISPERFLLSCIFAWSDRIKTVETPVDFILKSAEYFRTHTHEDDNFYIPTDDYTYLAHRTEKGQIVYFKRRGFVSYSDKGAIVQSPEALRYVTKYLSKDQEYYNLPIIKDFTTFVKKLPKINLSECDDKELVRLVKSCKNVLPFSLSSAHLGDNLLDEFSVEECVDSVEAENLIKAKFLEQKPITVAGWNEMFAVPKYILRKIFNYDIDVPCKNYNTDKRVSLLTPLGLEVTKLRSKLRIKDNTLKFQLWLSDSYYNIVKGFLTDSNVYHDSFIRLSIIEELHKRLPKNLDCELLALYDMYYRNVSLWQYQYDGINVETWQKYEYQRVSDLILDEELLTHNIYNHDIDSFIHDKYNRDYVESFKLFNDLPIFDGYDDALTYISFCRSYISEYRSIDKQRFEKVGEILRSFYKSFKYY